MNGTAKEGSCGTRRRLQPLSPSCVAGCLPWVEIVDPGCQINDAGFAEAALAVVDGWIAFGVLDAGAQPVVR